MLRAPIPSFSHPKTTEKLLSLLQRRDLAGARVLDLGAGAGYFSWKLAEHLESRGLDPQSIITPCDLHPELFQYDGLECVPSDFSEALPFADDAFNAVICMEVVEHLPDQLQLWREIARVLKPGGTVLMTTPNVLNLNARLRFLASGTMPLFDILPISDNDVVQVTGHIAPVSLYYLFFFARLAGFSKVEFHIDRVKKSAAIFAPAFWAAAQVANGVLNVRRRAEPYYDENKPAIGALNSWRTFVGRTIIVEATL